MLYVVGDSNSVYTSEFLISPDIDTSMCRIGWTTEEVLRAVKRKKSMEDASAFFVFVGLNDSLTGEGIAANILQIVAVLRAKRPSARVPIFLAPPFCVVAASPSTICTHRRDAARRILRELGEDVLGTHVVLAHVTKDMYVKKAAQITKPGSSKLDPLHLSRAGYMAVATVVNQELVLHSQYTRRPHKPKIIYEAGPK
jgi:lysophospholipase L1-like esterase